MAIDSIGSNTSYTQLLNSTSSARKYGSDDSAGASITATSGGKFADAIGQALSQLGASPTAGASSTSGSATDGASGTADQGGSSAVASFADQLFAALQSQIGAQAGTQGSAAPATTDASSAVSGVGGASGSNGSSVASAPVSGGGGHHHHGGGGGGKVAGGLDSLIQQLSTSSDSVATSADSTGATASDSDAVGATAAASATTSATGASANSASALQSSYDALVAASGNSGNAPSLTQFLQTLSQNLHGAPTAGNVVSTKA